MTNPVTHVAAMSPYSLASLEAPSGTRLVSLSQNESLRPPSPLVTEAIQSATAHSQCYPDPDWRDLRGTIAAHHGIDSERILCGNGSLDLIGCLARCYLSPGDAALAPKHAYPFFETATLMTGARFDRAKEVNLCANVETLLSAVRSDTKIVFVANPGNPTGTRLSRSELVRLRDGLPETVLLVIDEAYGEFSDHMEKRVFDLVERDNTIVLRTFSKAYGLAGMRVGWGYFPSGVAAQIRKVMNPNNVSMPGQLAATAAMSDHAYMRETVEETASLRDRFITRMRAAGVHVPVSHTNFALVQFASSDVSSRVDQALRKKGVFLRAQRGAGLPDCLRATVGVAEDMDLAAQLIETALQREAS